MNYQDEKAGKQRAIQSLAKLHPGIVVDRECKILNDRGEIFPDAIAAANHDQVSPGGVVMAADGRIWKCKGRFYWNA